MSLSKNIDDVCNRLRQPDCPVASRMRAIFALKSWGGSRAVEALALAMRRDISVLVKHEAAYCLGQMRDSSALPHLEEALRDKHEDPVVRHEAAEALGAIGSASSIPVLEEHAVDTHPQEVYETCRLALRRIRLVADSGESPDVGQAEDPGSCVYSSVDPAPATQVGGTDSFPSSSVRELTAFLCDSGNELFERYRAMFALRNVGTDEAVLGLCKGMKLEQSSALFRHEIAFVLGQIQNPVSIDTLSHFLEDSKEHEMVRHEAAEALGSMADPKCEAILRRFLDDASDVVRESVAVALDISDYVGDDSAFHYTDTVTAQPEGNTPLEVRPTPV